MGKDSSLDWRAGMDPTVPNSARMYDYYLGGSNSFPADIAAARRLIEIQPLIEPASRENRHFLRRVVWHLADDLGIRQFLDIGAGLPTAGNVHEVAPRARVLYVDHDPVVGAHARALMAGEDRVQVLQGDAREPDAILGDPVTTGFLDFEQPIGLLMIGLLHFVPDRDGAHKVVPPFLRALPPGSYLAISHGMTDGFDAGTVDGISQVYEDAMPYQLRTRLQIAAFFDGLEMLEPGLVPITEWRPDGVGEGITAQEVGVLGGVARIP
ncbi:SAM-dependent methyltransferase [Nonomuraea sp. NPDC026600]|uniref:SAM-dependent methyltransferase n=1 Tax=Nonomuraea sp. NPDC026600 TaxID=3155363 RepID=UPI0033F814AA